MEEISLLIKGLVVVVLDSQSRVSGFKIIRLLQVPFGLLSMQGQLNEY